MPRPVVAALLLLSALAASVRAENWPEFRGPTGQGISNEKKVPVEWGPEKNVRWRAPIPGGGWSSPIYWDGRLYLTTAVPVADGRPNDQHLDTLCLDAADGHVIWQKTVFVQTHDGAQIHGKNSHATPTPITDGRHVWVHFGTEGTACLTVAGDVVWSTRELKYKPQHGGGSSPVLVDGLLIVTADGSDIQFVAAFDAATGAVRWRKDRPPLDSRKRFSFSTPLTIEVAGGTQLISPAADQLVAYRPADGKELWTFGYTGYSVVPRPVFGHGLVFFSTSFDRPTLYALRPGTGEDAPKAVWEIEKGAPNTPSPLLIGDELYFISDRGVGTCVDAETGEVRWVERIGGNFSASPTFAGGLIYFQNEDGATVVVRPGTEYREVTRNSLPGRTLASFAVADSAIFLRTDSHLYRLQAE